MPKDDRSLALDAASRAAARHRNGRERATELLALRNAAMSDAFNAGATMNEIAAAVGVSAEAVSKALGRPQLEGAARRVAAR